jgi:DnaJ family protein A protein 2
LDGRELLIKTRPGEIIQAELKDDGGRTLPFIKMVKDEGMPSLGNPFVKGDLYIAFHVKFPESLPEETIQELKKILPGGEEMDEEYDADKVEEHFMDTADLRHFGKGGAAATGGEYDSDDDEGAGGVQCQQS